MKQILLCFLLVLFVLPGKLQAQIITPQIKARFGVDADLRSNFFSGFLQAGNDDWFSNGGSGTGVAVIDTTGAAFIVQRYTTNPASRMWPLFKGMAYPQFSIVSNRMLIDAVFIRDHHGDDSTVYSGGNKNGMNPDNWTTPVSQGIPDKNDILDMFMHVRRDGVNSTDSLWFFGGLSLDNVTGNRYFDFEMYQTDIYYDKPSLKFYGYGPDAGHTSWLFDAGGNVTRAGDIIFTAEYSSSSLSFLQARIWVHSSALSTTPVAFNWGGEFDGASSGATFGYASIVPKTAGDFYTGMQSSNNTWAGPFQCVLQNNALITNYTARQFMEFSVNLSKLGLDPLVTINDACALPFRRLLVKSRASTSFTAELKDFVGPFSFFRAPRAEVQTNFPVLCNNMVSTIWVNNPINTSIYTWRTINGNIVGDSVGPSINVNQAGLYVVTQQLMDSCGSTYATDTIEITMASTCQVLNTYLSELKVKKEPDAFWVSWQSDVGGASDYFELQRSTDGIHFTTIAYVPVETDRSYAVPDAEAEQLPDKWIFYRLKFTQAGKGSIFSKAVAVNNLKTNLVAFQTQPNPVTSVLQVQLQLQRTQPVELIVRTVNGALLERRKLQGLTGSNNWQVQRNNNWLPGMHILELHLADKVLRKRFLVQ